MDEKVLRSLDFADHFRVIHGQRPQEVLRQLKAGPGGHLRTHAYRCKLDTELARSARLKACVCGVLGWRWCAALWRGVSDWQRSDQSPIIHSSTVLAALLTQHTAHSAAGHTSPK